MDQLDAFRTFAAVADAGGFAAAARRLGRSPAAVTRTIAALEVHLATQLLRRTTRVTVLTDAGARFLVDAKRILADVEESTARTTGAHGSLRGEIAVTAPVMFGRLHVVPVVLAFLDQHPETSIRSLLVDRVVDLHEERVDVAVRIAALRDSSLRAARVGGVWRVACASPAYVAAHGKPRTPEDLRKHDVVVFSDGAPVREIVFRQDRRVRRVPITPHLSANDNDTTIAAAVAGRGITFALSYQIADHVRAGRLVVVLRDHAPSIVPIHVVHAAGKTAPARVRAFFDHVVERLRSDARLDPTKALTPR